MNVMLPSKGLEYLLHPAISLLENPYMTYTKPRNVVSYELLC